VKKSLESSDAEYQAGLARDPGLDCHLLEGFLDQEVPLAPSTRSRLFSFFRLWHKKSMVNFYPCSESWRDISNSNPDARAMILGAMEKSGLDADSWLNFACDFFSSQRLGWHGQ